MDTIERKAFMLAIACAAVLGSLLATGAILLYLTLTAPGAHL